MSRKSTRPAEPARIANARRAASQLLSDLRSGDPARQQPAAERIRTALRLDKSVEDVVAAAAETTRAQAYAVIAATLGFDSWNAFLQAARTEAKAGSAPRERSGAQALRVRLDSLMAEAQELHRAVERPHPHDVADLSERWTRALDEVSALAGAEEPRPSVTHVLERGGIIVVLEDDQADTTRKARFLMQNGVPTVALLGANEEPIAEVALDLADEKTQFICWDRRGMDGADGHIALKLDEDGYCTDVQVNDMELGRPDEPRTFGAKLNEDGTMPTTERQREAATTLLVWLRTQNGPVEVSTVEAHAKTLGIPFSDYIVGMALLDQEELVDADYMERTVMAYPETPCPSREYIHSCRHPQGAGHAGEHFNGSLRW